MNKDPFYYCRVDKNPSVWERKEDGSNHIVKVIDCDFDKRCTVEDDEGTYEIKWSYLFETEEKLIEALDTGYEGKWDCINPFKILQSNKNYNLFKKLYRKRAETSEYQVDYELNTGETVTVGSYRTQKEALRKYKTLCKNDTDYKKVQLHQDWSILVDYEDKEHTTYYGRSGICKIKTRHLKEVL